MCDCHDCYDCPKCQIEDEDDDREYSELDEEDAFDDEQDRLAQCTCGAYSWSVKQGRYLTVADCVCGNT